jgi:hypothetical protein
VDCGGEANVSDGGPTERLPRITTGSEEEFMDRVDSLGLAVARFGESTDARVVLAVGWSISRHQAVRPTVRDPCIVCGCRRPSHTLSPDPDGEEGETTWACGECQYRCVDRDADGDEWVWPILQEAAASGDPDQVREQLGVLESANRRSGHHGEPALFFLAEAGTGGDP